MSIEEARNDVQGTAYRVCYDSDGADEVMVDADDYALAVLENTHRVSCNCHTWADDDRCRDYRRLLSQHEALK